MAVSPNVGIGGIRGTREQPKATTNAVPAFRRPESGMVLPRPKPSATVMATTTSTSMPSGRTTVTAAVATSRKQHAETQPTVKVNWLSKKQVAKAIKVKQSPSSKKATKGPTQVEPMDTDENTKSQPKSDQAKKSAGGSTPKSMSSGTESHRERSKSRTQTEHPKGSRHSHSSAPGTSKSGSKDTGSAAKKRGADISSVLQQGGAAPSPEEGMAAIPRTNQERKPVDYNLQPFLAPTFKVDQPKGGHLNEAPAVPS